MNEVRNASTPRPISWQTPSGRISMKGMLGNLVNSSEGTVINNEGPTGPTGPAGSGGNLPQGTRLGDYLVWNGIDSYTGAGNRVILGPNAGGVVFRPTDSSIRIGNRAGETGIIDSIDNISIAIGLAAGANLQTSNSAISIGTLAGYDNQDSFSIAIGPIAGYRRQGNSAIAIGLSSGYVDQGNNSIAIGSNAGLSEQSQECVAIGYNAGNTGQLANSVAIGSHAGAANQSQECVSIGYYAGSGNQRSKTVAIGSTAGSINQGTGSVAIGYGAGANADNNQLGLGEWSIAIGNLAAQQGSAPNTIVLNAQSDIQLNPTTGGLHIKPINQSGNSANVLYYDSNSGEVTFNSDLITVPRATNIGEYLAWNGYEYAVQTNKIILGTNAGYTGQNNNAIAIGDQAGYSEQGDSAIAIGKLSGNTGQGNHAIAIGEQAGMTNQGPNSIAIGKQAGKTNLPENAIVINAHNNHLNPNNSGLYIMPINDGISTGNLLTYNKVTGEISVNNTGKTFVIDHPIEQEKYLVHACLEGPEAGVYYRGVSFIEDDKEYTEVTLPNYVSRFATDLTVQLTALYGGADNLKTTEVIDGKFKVYGTPGKFNWFVMGKRGDIIVEPVKNEVNIKGDGPYKWIQS